MTFVLFNETTPAEARKEEKIEVRWSGAPPHVRPFLVECRNNLVRLHTGRGERVFPLDVLKREVAIVKQMREARSGELGPAPTRNQVWLMYKMQLPGEGRLFGSFTRFAHDIEVSNLSGENRRRQIERYPILLVYPDGLETYELVSFLLDSTTRLATGVEPMLQGWSLPYISKNGGG